MTSTDHLGRKPLSIPQRLPALLAKIVRQILRPFHTTPALASVHDDLPAAVTEFAAHSAVAPNVPVVIISSCPSVRKRHGLPKN